MSGPGFTVPPGRAGRLWLTRRLAVARRGADLLDRKHRILLAETARLRDAAARTAAEWDRCCADAERWLLRASMLGGERAIRLAAAGSAADVTIRYAVTMGVRHPDGATCRIPASATWDGPALAAARQAHGRALEAAVRHAAAAGALRAVEAEALATRYRLRAVRNRWIPRLEQALADVTLALEEQELADSARLRLAADGPAQGAGSAGQRPAWPRPGCQLSCLIIETSDVAGETSASTPQEWLKSSSLAGSLTRAMTRGTLKRFLARSEMTRLSSSDCVQATRTSARSAPAASRVDGTSASPYMARRPALASADSRPGSVSMTVTSSPARWSASATCSASPVPRSR